MTPRNVLPSRPLSLALANGEGRDVQGSCSAGVFLHETLTCNTHGPWGQASILISHFPRDLASTLGIVAHELAHATQPRSGPAHGRGFAQAIQSLELINDRKPALAGLENAHRYPYWAYRIADALGSPPKEPDLHLPQSKGPSEVATALLHRTKRQTIAVERRNRPNPRRSILTAVKPFIPDLHFFAFRFIDMTTPAFVKHRDYPAFHANRPRTFGSLDSIIRQLGRTASHSSNAFIAAYLHINKKTCAAKPAQP